MKLTNLNDFPELTKVDEKEVFALDVLMGLSSKPKSLPPKYYYDEAGSKYFQEICDAEDYYPTRCEAEIFDSHKKAIVERFPDEESLLVELGAGDGRKTKILLNEAKEQGKSIKYCPVDISPSALEGLVGDLSKDYSSLAVEGIIGDYFAALKWLNSKTGLPKTVLFLGGNVGNFSLPQTKTFLKTLWNSLNNGDQVLIGFDLKKDIDVLLSAYNDSDGATKRFNLNLLHRINRDLNSNFDVSKFSHFGTYNVKLGAMESFLVSLEKQEVKIGHLDITLQFKAFEAIHCEYSFKYLLSDIEQLAKDTGFEVVTEYQDSKKYFADVLFKVRKQKGL